MTDRLGMVTAGSLTKGLDARLDPALSSEDVKVGQYVVVQTARTRFFCVVSDIELQAVDTALTANDPDLLTREVLQGTGTFGVAHLVPTLAIGPEGEPGPVRTIPSHFAPVHHATRAEIEEVFGEDDAKHLWVGSPLDMEEAPICLDIQRLVERSTGVFGKSGTGKTYLTRILMAGILQKRAAVQLIFDMHNEYGWAGTSERGSGSVKGLKQLFGSQVAVFTLDEAGSRARGVSTDGTIQIGYDELEPEDFESMVDTLNLNEVQLDAIHQLSRRGGAHWLAGLLSQDKDAISLNAAEYNIPEATLTTVQRRLRALERLSFLDPQRKGDAAHDLIDYLIREKTVVLEFGRYRSHELSQVLVANVLSRRIYNRWAHAVESAMGDRAKEPPQLIVTIEEAHKFLDTRMAGKTIFGTIAREMRKYNVTLLVVDQRPSAIDPEVLSQIGTKISCLVDDEKDVSALLSGASGANELKNVLTRLESVQQALIFGHAVPMPVVIRTRTYGDPESYKSFGYLSDEALVKQAKRDERDLFGP